MKEKKGKRYLVTYKDQAIGSSEASSILGVSKKDCKDGVSFMETDAIPGKKDVLHFEHVGVSSIELSDEEKSKLLKNKEVLAVEEDIEMHVLELTNEEEQAEYINASLLDSSAGDSLAYDEGYHNAMVDMFSSMLYLGTRGKTPVNGNGERVNSPLPINPRPIHPIQPFPRLPIFPPISLPKQPIPWNISMVKAPEAWAKGYQGSGVKVAILDTGIANHTDLSISGGVSFISGVTSYNDGHSHGTHCAGIVAAKNNIIGVVGVAPLSKLYAVKVLSDGGSGPMSGVIAGMDWCITNGMQVASMSLGSSSAPSAAYSNAVKRCQDNGITVVAATGNSGYSSFPYVGAPANSYQRGTSKASPIAVGSVNQSSILAGSSSRGGEHSEWNQVTVVAPGVNVNSTILNNGYGTKSGTSMACPHVAGLAALIYEKYPGISPVNVERRITSSANDLGDSGYDTLYGYGLINCEKAIA